MFPDLTMQYSTPSAFDHDLLMCSKLLAHAQQKGHRAGWAECTECGRCTVRLLQGGSGAAAGSGVAAPAIGNKAAGMVAAPLAAAGAATVGVKRSASLPGQLRPAAKRQRRHKRG